MPATLPYYKPLTGIRAVAAYLVFAHHYLNKEADFINELHIGVTVFFTLSGLLITLRYLDQLRLSGSCLRRYFLNRFARIYPTYLLLTGVAFFFAWQQAGITADYWLALALNLTFLRGFSETYLCTGVAQGWSLTVEETFYLLAPLLLYALGRTAPARYWRVLVAMVLGSGAVGAGLTLAFHGTPAGFFSDYHLLLGYTFFGRAAEFAIGAGLALVLRQQAAGTLQISVRGQVASTWLGLGGIIGVVLGLVAVRQHYDLGFGTAHWLGNVLNNGLLPVAIAVLFYGLVCQPTRLARLLGSRPAQVLGRSSYCFYLLHLGFVPQRIILSQPWLAGWWYPLQILLVFGLVLAASIGLHYGFEEPLNRRIRHWFRSDTSS